MSHPCQRKYSQLDNLYGSNHSSPSMESTVWIDPMKRSINLNTRISYRRLPRRFTKLFVVNFEMY